MLDDYRVIDLSDERGMLCGQLLADLGADVVVVEPPGGSPARREGPFAGDIDDPERSLPWWSYARGKRSVVLDLESEDGRASLSRLIAGADFLVESFDPGYLAARRLGYEDVAATNPSIVYVSITPFGQDGSKAEYAATDLTVSAASGLLAAFGDEDRPPLRFGVPQAYLHGGAMAAAAALIAHHERRGSGRGQHVDVSVQQALAQATQSNILNAAVGAPDLQRYRGGTIFGGLPVPLVWRAKDGFASLTFLFGQAIGPFTRRLMEWICEEGGCDEATRDKDWIGYTELLLSGQEPIDEYQRVLGVVRDFLASKTKLDLQEEALRRRLLIVPMATMAELSESEQFTARAYWQELDHPLVDRPVRLPGPFARFGAPTAQPLRAPTVDEHRDELSGELAGAQTRVPVFAGTARTSDAVLPLEGLKVVDLMWVVAGPQATRMLADFGASVVKVESTSHVDTSRTLSPFKNAQPGPESSVLFQNMNAGKLGVTLDLSTEQGREVLCDLVEWADVLAESFSPRAMRAWGLDYERLRERNPRLIMLSSSLFGQTGPLAMLAGFGTMGAAAAGFNSIVGWPDREPAMVGAYTDYVAPYYTVAALMAAIEHRERTGEGQHIDLSQAEAALHFLAPALLDCGVNGREAELRGNRDSRMAPHAVYPAAGTDRWVAIAVRDDVDWQNLCDVIGRPQLADDARYATAAARLAHQEELDDLVGTWTREREADTAEAELQRRAIPAHAVNSSTQAVADPQLRHRGHFVTLDHPVVGEVTVEAPRAQLSRTPGRVGGCGPTFGRDNFEVLSGILGYDAERIAALAAADVLR